MWRSPAQVRRDRRRRRAGGAAVATLMLGALLVPALMAGATSVQITSAGPLTRIATSSDLNCSADHLLDGTGAFYGDTACVTALAVGSSLFRPSVVPIGDEILGGSLLLGTFNQVGPTGTGSAADPYTIATNAITDDQLTDVLQRDSYVVGSESWRTDVSIRNRRTTSVTATLYRAADCNLQESDYGFGSYDPATGAVACRGVADPLDETPEPGPRLEQWTPLTPGSRAFEGPMEEMWTLMAARQPFPASCSCGDYVDNGAGLSWTVTLPPSEWVTISSLVSISPSGVSPLTTSVAADAPSTPAGGENGYTVTIANPNGAPKALTSVSNLLPDGFAYRPGTTSGVVASDPDINDQQLTWDSPVVVPANGSASFHFGVTVSNVEGTYYDLAGGDGGPTTVVAAEQAAPIVVGPAANDDPPTVDAGPVLDAAEGFAFAVEGSVVDPDSSPTSTWTVTPGADTDPGATCTPEDAADPSTNFTCNDDGSFTFTLTAFDEGFPPVTDTTVATVRNVAPGVVSPVTQVGAGVGETVPFEVFTGDAGSNDTLTCVLDRGDGSTVTGAVTAGACRVSTVYAIPDMYAASVVVTDDDGDSASAPFEVTIEGAPDAPPVVDAGDDLAAAEGSSFDVAGSVVDDSAAVAISWSVVPGAGVDIGATCAASSPGTASTAFVCDDDGTFTLRLTADDGVNELVSDDLQVVVSNASPTVSVTTPTVSGLVGATVTVAAAVGDPATHDTLTCSIAWGDGSTSPAPVIAGSCAGSHAYSSPGEKTVTITVADDDGGSRVATARATITSAPPVGQRVQLVLTGSLSYSLDSTATSGRLVVTTDGLGVSRITGTVTLPGVRSATATVTIDLTRFGPFQVWFGSVTWKDGTFGGTAPFLNSSIRSTNGSVTGSTNWLAGKFPWSPYALRFSVTS